MAMTERQIMDKVYEEAEAIHKAIGEAERRIDKLAEEQSGSFRFHARSVFIRNVKGTKPRARRTAPTQLRAAGGAQ